MHLAWLSEVWSGIRQSFSRRMESRARSGSWRTFRNAFIREHPTCLSCGKRAEEVHHGEPYHHAPERELDPANCFAYCRACHYFVCHFGDWKTHNPEHTKLAAIYLALVLAYRERSRAGLVPQGAVIFDTSLRLMSDEYDHKMSETMKKSLVALQRFITKQQVVPYESCAVHDCSG